LGGENYVKALRDTFSSKNILSPLSGCKGIGYMMKKLNDAIQKGIPL